jgi:16S rRNA (guanine1207-N2)-methyltransferase
VRALQDLQLHRWPEDPTLRAFDQADLYALDAVEERLSTGRLLLGLDAFGALACALGDRDRVGAGDSEVARLALRANESRNDLSECPWVDLDSIEGPFDAAVIKVPRQKGLLDAALARIRPALAESAPVIGAGMTRHVHNSTIASFERWIGPTTTSRARSRARLLFARAEVAPQPVPAPVEIPVPGEPFGLWLQPGVFARRGVDPGSALLLGRMPRLEDEGRDRTIVDAGCGSGLLTAAAAVRNPKAAVLGTDESHLAIRSTRMTLERAQLVHAEARVDDVLASVPDRSVDLVLGNPPQHQGAAPSRALLARFVEEAGRVLCLDGRVLMVANRHVNLNLALAERFDRVRIVDQDRRYMVCEATRPLSAVPRSA